MLATIPQYDTGYAHSRGESEYPWLWRGLIGSWWPAFGCTGSNVPDLSGSNRTGVGTNVTAADWSRLSGKFPRALSMNNSEFLSCGDLPDSGLFTYSIWAQRNTISTAYAVLVCGASSYLDMIAVYENGGIAFGDANSAPLYSTWSSVWSNKTAMHNIVVVPSAIGSAKSATLWFDGTNYGAPASTLNVDGTLSGFTIGNFTSSLTNRWNGYIAGVQVWRRALTEPEIKLIHTVSGAAHVRRRRIYSSGGLSPGFCGRFQL